MTRINQVSVDYGLFVPRAGINASLQVGPHSIVSQTRSPFNSLSLYPSKMPVRIYYYRIFILVTSILVLDSWRLPLVYINRRNSDRPSLGGIRAEEHRCSFSANREHRRTTLLLSYLHNFDTDYRFGFPSDPGVKMPTKFSRIKPRKKPSTSSQQQNPRLLSTRVYACIVHLSVTDSVEFSQSSSRSLVNPVTARSCISGRGATMRNCCFLITGCDAKVVFSCNRIKRVIETNFVD